MYPILTPKLKTLFLDTIFYFVDFSLYEYNYNLDSIWNFTIGGSLQVNESWGLNFGVTSQHELYLVYNTDEDLIIMKTNSSGALMSNFEWGEGYNFSPSMIRIDPHDSLYLLCSISYNDIWGEHIRSLILVKNPKSGGKPQLDQPIDEGLVFLFSLLGFTCFISALLVYSILKPKKKHK